MSSGLTEEQRRRIEENKRKAVAKLAGRQTPGTNKISHNLNFSLNAKPSQAEQSIPTSRPWNNPQGINKSGPSNRPDWVGSKAINGCGSSPLKTGASQPFRSSTGPPLCYSTQKIIGSSPTNLQQQPSGSNSYASFYSKSNAGPIQSVQAHCISNHAKEAKYKTNSTPKTESPSKGHFAAFGKQTLQGNCVLLSRDRFQVCVGYNAALIEVFKSMDTKLYDPATRKWSFLLKEYSKFMEAMTPLQPAVEIQPLPQAVQQTFAAQFKGENPDNRIPVADLTGVDPFLVDSLMPFQREGVSFGIYKNGRLLLADDMGLGKTIQAICLCTYYRHDWPVLIVCPSSVRFNWAEEFRRWVPSLDRQSINVVTNIKDSCISGTVNILSYDLMSRRIDVLKKKKFQVIVMDESHLLKNSKAARTKAALPMLQNAKRVFLLTGTPALSRPIELFPQVAAVVPRMFKFHDFGVRYCEGKQQPWGWDYSGSSNMAELQILLEERVMIRRLKKNVLSQLPDKRREMVILDPQSVKSTKELQNASKIHGKTKGSQQRGALLEYFHQTAHAKIQAVRDYISDLLDAEKKFLLFAHHQELLDALEDVIKQKIDKSYIRIDGQTKSEQRKYFCDKFQNDDSVRVALLSITACNAGLNLCAASLVVFAELFWNPGILIQAEDRAHRIGQLDSVLVQYLVAQGTADDCIWPLVQKKLNILSKAGLAKENFSDADSTCQKVEQKQTDIMSFFEESFFDDFDEDKSMNKDSIITTEVESKEKKIGTKKIDNYFQKNDNDLTGTSRDRTDRPSQSATKREHTASSEVTLKPQIIHRDNTGNDLLSVIDEEFSIFDDDDDDWQEPKAKKTKVH